MRIQSVDAFPVRYPTRGRFKFLEAPDGTPQGRAAVVVRLTADDGTVGWGESVPMPAWTYETLEGTTIAIREYFAPVLIGRDAYDLEGAHQAMNRVIKPGYTTGCPLARAGVDIALHDLCGKAMNVSLPQLWGRSAPETLTLSWTVNPSSLDQVDALIDQGWEQGFRHFNVKVAPDLKTDLELCRLVRDRVPDGFLWADANCGYDLATALKAAPRLADLGVDVLEAPVAPNQISGYQQLRAQGALPILMDEGVVSPRDLLEFFRLGMIDGVALKPARCGGLVSARRQIELLADAGLMFLGSGLTDPDVSLAASLALYGAYGLGFPAALNGPQFLDHSIVTNPFVPSGGSLPVPAGPGLGIDIDEDKLNAIRVDIQT